DLKRTTYDFGLMRVDALLDQRNFQRTGLSFGTVLFTLASLVLGVACLNYANLATARAAGRAREIGVRKALGAKPRQVAAQSLVEAGLLTATALVTAVAVFSLSGPVIEDLLRVNLAPTLFDGFGVWIFLAAVVVGVTFVAGFYPAIVLARVRPASAIASSDVRVGSKFFSTVLVGTQFAAASALLLAVLIVALQNAAVRRSGLGITEDPLLVIENPRRVTKVEPATLRAELTRLPQVKGVTEVASVPWEMTMVSAYRGSLDPTSAARPVIMRNVGEDFFGVFDIRLVAGRLLGGDHAEDLPPPPAPPPANAGAAGGGSSGRGAPGSGTASSGAPGAGAAGNGGSAGGAPGAATPASPATPPRVINVVVDLQFAELFFGSAAEAVGKTVYPPANSDNPTQVPSGRVIVGVVDNRSFNYMNFGDNAIGGVQYLLQPALDYTVARVDRANVEGTVARLDALWRELAPNVPLTRRFLDDVFNQSFEYYLRLNRLFALLAIMAFTISSTGLFGMATLVAARRRREIGVRKTFGASTAQVVQLLLAGFSKPVVIANIVVWPAAFFGARAYLEQFFEPAPLNALPFVASLAVTLAIAWFAVGGQTWRAARRAPAAVLRRE
ncbi:MAG TPA: FtsX-like permease family protein, partial [Gammaproteobacteria bacterium]|nr:FtsX-like permease family protein [Gammaproteobacteria bacterium]